MKFLITIYRPNGYDPSGETASMASDIDALNDAMVAAGVRVFVGGLRAPGEAKELRFGPGGAIEAADGLYLPTSEHVGGLWVLDCADLEEAVGWGKQAAAACRASVEVRAFH